MIKKKYYKKKNSYSLLSIVKFGVLSIIISLYPKSRPKPYSFTTNLLRSDIGFNIPNLTLSTVLIIWLAALVVGSLTTIGINIMITSPEPIFYMPECLFCGYTFIGK